MEKYLEELLRTEQIRAEAIEYVIRRRFLC